MAVSRESLERLKTAFTMHALRVVVEADGVIDWDEIQVVQTAFPGGEPEAFGFVDADGLTTPAFDAAVEEALEVLPREVTLKDKLELVTLLHRTCMADGHLDPREFDALCRAAALVDLSANTLARHLDSITHRNRRTPPVKG